ncbi:MAG: S9 family peptidase [Candidatus Bipolaricaulota bacterium]
MQPVKIEDLLSYRFLSRVCISPSGEWAAFVVKQADVERNDYRSDVYLAHLSQSLVRRLTTSGRDGPFVWECDGKGILFISRREEPEEGCYLFRILLDGGEAERIAKIPHKAKDLALLEDGRLLFTSRVPVGERDESEDAKDYEILDEIPFWQNGEGITNRRRVRLFLFDPGSGEATLLTEEEIEVKDFDILGDRIAFTARRFPGKAPGTDELWWIEGLGAPRCLSRDVYAFDAVGFLDRDTLVVLASDMQRYGRGENREVHTVGLASGRMQSLTPGWDRSCGNSVGGDVRHGGGPTLAVDAGRIHVTVTERSRSFVISVDRSGQVAQATVPRGSVDAFDVRQGSVVAVELHPDRLQELYLHRGGKARRLTDLNAESLAGRAVSVPEPFTVRTSDGTERDAWLIKPVGFEPGKRYPAILAIHGGPRTAHGDVFFHEMQTLAGAGYALVYTNPRGSSGRGNEFADLRAKYGTVDYDDLMVTVDEALRRYPFLDAERVGVMGGSYGGFMTNWIIGHTDRFRAAVSQRSIANWTSKFCTTDIGYLFNRDQMGADPWEEGGNEKLWWHSPLQYADRVKTPTLFIHSDEDYRCWLAEGLQMFTALRYHGVESRVVLFRGENHELSRSGKPKHRLRRLREIHAWFDRHLGRP